MTMPILMKINMFLHVLAFSVWVGSQIFLIAVIPVLLKAGNDKKTLFTLIGKRFTLVGGVFALPLLLVTGTMNIYFLHINLQTLLFNDSEYIASLRIKIVLFLIMGTLGILHDLVSRFYRGDSKFIIKLNRLSGLVIFALSMVILYLGSTLRYGGL